MAVVVSLLLIAAIVAIAWAVVDVVRRLSRGARGTAARTASREGDATPPFGALPHISPVGALGEVAPDTDINSSGTDERNVSDGSG